MSVYIEYAIIDNMVINSLLLYLTSYFLKLNSSKKSIFFSALIGTICSLISPILPIYLNNILKILLSITMPFIILKKPTFKKIITTTLTFLLCTVLFIGGCIVFCFSFNIEYIFSSNGEIAYNFPVGLAILLCSFIFLILKKLIKLFYCKKQINNFIYEVEFNENEITYKTTGFLDSGNFLTDEVTKKPICLINFNVFNNLFPKTNIGNLLLKKIDSLPIKNARYINVSSIGKSQEILVFEIEKMVIFSGFSDKNNKNLTIDNILLGLSLKNFTQNLNAECILNYQLLM